MEIDPKVFKAYDIRGLYPSQINEQNITSIVRAIYKFFVDSIGKKQLTVVLSYDMRLSGPQLFAAAKKTLVEMGAHVIDTGKLSTPSFYFAVTHYGYDCGIQVTASHNPKEWNGIKFVKNTPDGLLKIGKAQGMDDVKRMAMEGVEFVADAPGMVEEKTGILEDEVENALELFGHPQIKKFKIVADPGNAMGATYIDALFKQVPADLVRMNFELDGSFPVHQPDPMQPKNLVDLQKRVLEEKADLGLAPDGDGDRLFIINEKGEVVPPPQIIGMLAKELLKDYPHAKIAVDQKYYLTAKKVVEENGGELILSKTGHAYITETLTKTGAIFAGEASAHYYYKSTGNAESQVTTILGVLKVLTDTNKPLSEAAENFRRSYESGEINFEVENSPEIIEEIKKKYPDGELSTMDGISLTYPTWRFNLRNSNTEPLLRLNVEGYDKKEMETKRDELVALITGLKK